MATKLKTKAQAYAAQTRDVVQMDIKLMGDLQRERSRLGADLNDAIAELTQAAAPRIDALNELCTALQQGVQTWCEAHREELCGKGKSANLVTGEVQWRQRPPSVRVTGQDAVLAYLKAQGLSKFIRVREEVNKEMLLAEVEQARGIPGISIVTGVEDFIITPFEVDTQEAA